MYKATCVCVCVCVCVWCHFSTSTLWHYRHHDHIRCSVVYTLRRAAVTWWLNRRLGDITLGAGRPPTTSLTDGDTMCADDPRCWTNLHLSFNKMILCKHMSQTSVLLMALVTSAGSADLFPQKGNEWRFILFRIVASVSLRSLQAVQTWLCTR